MLGFYFFWSTVQISLPPRMHISSLPHLYTAAQLHFHWGSSSRPTGSEHMVNSKQYAAEVNKTNSTYKILMQMMVVKSKDCLLHLSANCSGNNVMYFFKFHVLCT